MGFGTTKVPVARVVGAGAMKGINILTCLREHNPGKFQKASESSLIVLTEPSRKQSPTITSHLKAL